MDTGLNASKRIFHKAGEFSGKKIADPVTKSNNDKIVKPNENSRHFEEIIIPLEKKRRNIKQIEKSFIKLEHYKISKLLNDSIVSKFLTKKWIEINDLSSVQYSVTKMIMFKTSMLRSDIFDYSHTYIVLKGTIDLLAKKIILHLDHAFQKLIVH